MVASETSVSALMLALRPSVVQQGTSRRRRVAGAQLSRLALDRGHGQRAVQDDHEADSVVAAHDDLVAGGMLTVFICFSRGTDLRVRQPLQQLRLLQLHAQILCPRRSPDKTGISVRQISDLLPGFSLLFVEEYLVAAVRVLLAAVDDLRIAPEACSGSRDRAPPGPGVRPHRSPRAGWWRRCDVRRAAT